MKTTLTLITLITCSWFAEWSRNTAYVGVAWMYSYGTNHPETALQHPNRCSIGQLVKLKNFANLFFEVLNDYSTGPFSLRVSNGIFGCSLRIWHKIHNLLHLIYFKIQLILMNSGKIFIFHVLRDILMDLKYSDYFLVRSQQRQVSSRVSWDTYIKKMFMKYSSAPNQLTLIYCKQLNYSKRIFITSFYKYLMSTDRG